MIFLISDNGAPLRPAAWNGSLNLPFVGEKGMLTDGGIRVPFIIYWKGVLPRGLVYRQPVISLDVAATANAIAGLKSDAKLDGVNLIPFLKGEAKTPPHQTLYWRWRSQAAILDGKWKLVKFGAKHQFLFDMESKQGEKKNVAPAHPDIVQRLEKKLAAWAATQKPPGLPRTIARPDQVFFDAHLKAIAESAQNMSSNRSGIRQNSDEQPSAIAILANSATSSVHFADLKTPSQKQSNNFPLTLPSPLNGEGKLRGPERWEKAIAAFEKQDRAKPPPQNAILFVGSSSIRMWKLAKYFPDLKTINRGFGGSEMADVLHFAPGIILKYKPKIVVIYEGGNNIARGKTPEQLRMEFAALVRMIHAVLPGTKIIFLAVKPSLRRWNLAGVQRRANRLVADFGKTDKRLVFVDVFGLFKRFESSVYAFQETLRQLLPKNHL